MDVERKKKTFVCVKHFRIAVLSICSEPLMDIAEWSHTLVLARGLVGMVSWEKDCQGTVWSST